MNRRHLRLVDNKILTGKGVVRVAFATSDMHCVDQHFGTAEGFVIYSISAAGTVFNEAIQFSPADEDGDHAKLAPRLEFVADCSAVVCLAIGPSAIRELIRLEVQPVPIEAPTAISKLVKQLGNELVNDPPIWMSRALGTPATSVERDWIAAEAWSE